MLSYYFLPSCYCCHFISVIECSFIRAHHLVVAYFEGRLFFFINPLVLFLWLPHRLLIVSPLLFFSIAFNPFFFYQSNQPIACFGQICNIKCSTNSNTKPPFLPRFHKLRTKFKLCPTTFRWFLPLLCSLCFLEKATFENQWSHQQRAQRRQSWSPSAISLSPDATFTCSICGSMIALYSHLHWCHRWQAQPQRVSSTPILVTLS